MIVTPATVWVDDYEDWLSPSSGCCFTQNCCPQCILNGDDAWPEELTGLFTCKTEDIDTCDGNLL